VTIQNQEGFAQEHAAEHHDPEHGRPRDGAPARERGTVLVTASGRGSAAGVRAPTRRSGAELSKPLVQIVDRQVCEGLGQAAR
jgi:hypothetical protein